MQANDIKKRKEKQNLPILYGKIKGSNQFFISNQGYQRIGKQNTSSKSLVWLETYYAKLNGIKQHDEHHKPTS